MTATPSTTFTCGLCLFEKTGLGIGVGGSDLLCLGCHDEVLRPKFEAALENEAQWPVRWGSKELKPRLMSTAFQALWRKKTKEYTTSFTERVYCPHEGCKAFAGSKAELREHEGCFVTCRLCNGFSCGDCRVALQSEDDEHVCAVEEPSKEPDAFAGLERGKHYQICPGATCGIKVELRDGCNAMFCQRCMTHFCFLCGKKADHESTHWTQGSRCPRWGHPDAGSVLHDALGAHGGDDDDDEDLELDLEDIRRMEDDHRRLRELEHEQMLLQERDERPMVPVMLPAESPEMTTFNIQQGEIQQIVRQVYRLRAEAGNGQAPAWSGWLINFASLLTRNLRYYALDHDAMHWQAVQQQHDERDHRDEQMQFMLPHAAEGLAQYPLMRELYDAYLLRRRN